MASSIFAGLLTCDGCSHSIEAHEGGGCTAHPCTCPQTREGVIEANVASAKRERAVAEAPDP